MVRDVVCDGSETSEGSKGVKVSPMGICQEVRSVPFNSTSHALSTLHPPTTLMVCSQVHLRPLSANHVALTVDKEDRRKPIQRRHRVSCLYLCQVLGIATRTYRGWAGLSMWMIVVLEASYPPSPSFRGVMTALARFVKVAINTTVACRNPMAVRSA